MELVHSDLASLSVSNKKTIEKPARKIKEIMWTICHYHASFQKLNPTMRLKFLMAAGTKCLIVNHRFLGLIDSSEVVKLKEHKKFQVHKNQYFQLLVR